MNWESLQYWLEQKYIVDKSEPRGKVCLSIGLGSSNAIEIEEFRNAVYFTYMEWDETGGVITEETLFVMYEPTNVTVFSQAKSLVSDYEL